jgi:hypothetical protein
MKFLTGRWRGFAIRAIYSVALGAKISKEKIYKADSTDLLAGRPGRTNGHGLQIRASIFFCMNPQ